jgi:hypothetical protein
MRQPPHKAEQYRIHGGPWGSDASYGNNGAFFAGGPCGRDLKIIVSDGADKEPWEHVSVSLPNRCPNWPEMCFVKDLFWREDECVIQYHPAASDYVNQHPYCLHLWRPPGIDLPVPPPLLVGVKDMAAPTADEKKALRAWGVA